MRGGLAVFQFSPICEGGNLPAGLGRAGHTRRSVREKRGSLGMILKRRVCPALRRRDGKPLKHGNVECVTDCPHSCFHRYVKAGIYPYDWVGGLTSGLLAMFASLAEWLCRANPPKQKLTGLNLTNDVEMADVEMAGGKRPPPPPPLFSP